MRDKNKLGRTNKITEPMNAVDIAEIAELADLDLAGVTGGCARCGDPAHADPLRQAVANQNR